MSLKSKKSESEVVKYKIIFEGEEQDEIFDTEQAAEDYALYLCACCEQGAEDLHMNNPGDYEDEECDEPEYEIIEVKI